MLRTRTARIILALTAAGICGASLYPPQYWHGPQGDWPRTKTIRDSGGWGWVWQREGAEGHLYLAQVDFGTLFVEYIAILSAGAALFFMLAMRHPPRTKEQAVTPNTKEQTVKCEDCGRLVRPRNGACPECAGPLS